MGLKFYGLAMFMLLPLTSTTKAHDSSCIFDVTSTAYGGRDGCDITHALAKAWKDACASTSASKIVIPFGTYNVVGAHFLGPCNAPIEMQVEGTLKAPSDPSKLTRQDSWVCFELINNLTVSGGGAFNGQGSFAWRQKKRNTVNLRFNFINDSRIQDITSVDSKNFHIHLNEGYNVTFQHMQITAPEDSPNTDGIHIGNSALINITDSNIATGDDCISMGFGTEQVTVSNVTCGPGHGISIGSLGQYPDETSVSGVIVKNCTLIGTDNGLRIKTWANSPICTNASDIHFEDITLVNVSNPIIIDQEYCPSNKCNKSTPSKVKISNVSYKNIKGSSASALANKIVCSKAYPCEGVELANIDLTYTGGQGPITSQCSNVKPTISGVPAALACGNTDTTTTQSAFSLNVEIGHN